MNRFAPVPVAVLLLSLGSAGVELPPAVPAIAASALNEIGYGSSDRTKYQGDNEKATAFDSYVEHLAEGLDESMANEISSVEGENMEAKISILAQQRKMHRDLFDEIESTYCALPKDEMTRPRFRPAWGRTGIPAPRLREKHLAPVYRSAWEYCALKYANKRERMDSVIPGGVALIKIGDPRSLIVFEFLYKKAVLQQQQELSRESKHYCEFLWCFPGERGVSGLLNFHESAKSAKPRWADWREFETPADFFVYLFRNCPPSRQEEWRTAITAYDTSALTEGQRTFLKRIAEFQPPAPMPRPELVRKRRKSE